MARYSEYSGTRIGREMEGAIRLISRWQQQAVATMTEYGSDVNQTIDMLFKPDTIRKAIDAKGIIDPSSHVESYPVAVGVTLTVNYQEAYAPTIDERALCIQPALAAPLWACIGEIRAIHDKYEEVKGVLRWLNKNATLGATRAYFPSVLKLCPDTFMGMLDVPSRYDEPRDIKDWLQPIRDAGNTVAAAQLLPADAPIGRARKGLCLTFASTDVTIYTTDQIVYNL